MFARDHLLSATFLHIVFYILWFHYLETTVTDNYLVMHTRLDELIPLLPVLIVPYLLWFIYIFVALLYFNQMDRDETADLCLFLSLGMTVALFICIIFPNGAGLRVPADPANGLFAPLVRVTQSTDTPISVSLDTHVFNAFAVHVAVMRNRSPVRHPLMRRASLILMLLTCLSIVFLKQHSVLGAFGALLLGYFVNTVIYGSCEVPALVPAGVDALFRCKRNPAKAYRQLRKK